MNSRGLSFPKSARLRSRSQYLAMRSGCRRHRCGLFLVVWKRGVPGPARLGVTVSRKVSGAVGRNRVKRLVREVFRHSGDCLPEGMDVLVIAHPGAAEAASADVWRLLRAAFGAIGA